jgi:hypothetical protein
MNAARSLLKNAYKKCHSLYLGKDCRVIEGATRKDRDFCEPHNSPATKKDFKRLSGVFDNDSTKETCE